MNAHARASATYGGAQLAVKSPRQIEYQAFARITHALGVAAAEVGPAAFPRLAAALHDNLKLWTVIATDVALPGNALPNPLRARLFYLAEFTRVHTKRVLAREAEAAALIEINTTVMRGLRQGVEAQTCPA
ncbi:MAG: flagellar biosynthesis regulator FlaF [Paracoccaceae bacterium]